MYTMIPFRRRPLPNPVDQMLGDHFFRSFFDLGNPNGISAFRVDVKDQGDHYLLEAELPGVSRDQMNLSVDKDVLTISADLNTTKEEKQGDYVYSERRSGHMERRFNLEGIRQEDISATYKDGVLAVTLPKAVPQAEEGVRKIEIAETE